MTPTPTLILMTEEEVNRYVVPDDEPGFGSLSTPRGHLPLKAMDVQARIDGLLAEVALTQTFVNTLGEPLEATYIFPLPDRAAVTRFRMEVGGRVVEGALKERGAARREYDQAVQRGHRAAITEEERPGVFTLRVGNLMPGEAATIHLSLSGPLIYDSGEATFRFPLVVAPRYIPGQPLPGASVGDGVAPDTDAVPDASRISPPVLLPGYPNPVRLSLTVDVEPSALEPRDFRSSLHSVLSEADDRGVQRIRLEPGERLNRDFILRFRVGDTSVRSSLSLLPDRDGEEGTFVLTLVPPVGPARGSRPRDVVFVLDRSGSMSGWKMVAARRALGRMVDTLTEADRFTVYAFDDRVETPPEFRGAGMAAATDRNRFRAVEFLARVDARGGTEMAQPLNQAVEVLAGRRRQSAEAPQRDRILVLITDGQVGNEDQILKMLGKRLAGLRVFALGIDQAVNEGFLKRLATLGGGFCEVVESEDRLDEVMKRLHSRIGTPLLTGLRLEAAGFSVEERATVPSRVPDLFAGAALTIMGRYRGVPEGSFLVSGQDVAGRRWTEAVSSRVSANPALAAAWARAYVRELEDRFVTAPGEQAALERQIVEVSLKFGVLCRFTSFVAVDRSEVVNAGGSRHGIVQPVEMPAGWAGAPEMLARSLSPGMGAVFQACAAVPPPAPCATPPVESDEKDIFETDFEVPALDDESGSQAVALDDADNDLGSSEFELALDSEEAEPQARKPQPPPPVPSARGKKARGASTPQGKDQLRPGSSDADRGRAPRMAFGEHESSGLVGKVFGFFKRGQKKAEKTAAPPQESVDLTAYRRRAQDLLDNLNSTVSLELPQRIEELGVLMLKLRALIEDLKSVGADPATLEGLERLHHDLERLLVLDRQEAALVEKMWQHAIETLQAFSGGATVPAARREDFWK